MPFAKLVIIQPGHASREFKVETDLVTIGRALDNLIALEDDSNISRYHAEIDLRIDDFWVADLGSRNGTTVNDQPIELARQLNDGDLICVGGSTMIAFHLSETPFAQSEEIPEEPIASSAQPSAPESPSINVVGSAGSVAAGTVTPLPAVTVPATGLSPVYIVGAILGGLVLTGAVGLVLFLSSSRRCKATAHIVSPQSGTTVKGPIPIRVEAEETQCIDRLIYQLDGAKVASSEIPPYQATLDPEDISGLRPGNHVLTVTVEDDRGNRSIQADEVVLGFEVAQTKTSENNNEQGQSGSDRSGQQTTSGQQSLSANDIKQMCDSLLRELSAKHDYALDRELLHQIQARTSDYATPGFFSRARPFRDVINDSFVNEQGLEKPLGYVLAMSRSNFDLSRGKTAGNTEGDGLWKVPLTLAQNAGYTGRCGTTAMTDQNQKCAAMVAAAYMKALEVDLFGGDPLYAIACFGMTPKDAAQWRDQLPADRRDLWNVIKSAAQREQVSRFLAAGIVGENPQQFGLTSDSPLSNLYPK
jgi:pSer/pThr/pTyr-binding forkhead associated (FHA) protein